MNFCRCFLQNSSDSVGCRATGLLNQKCHGVCFINQTQPTIVVFRPTITKSKGIFGLSKILIDKHNGEVPQSFEALEALPAVGHKTASVVMAQAFGVPAFPVDTHIHRLMYRWNLSNGKSVAQTEKDAKRLFPKELWNDLHLQIIWYGREYSPARGWNLENDLITKTIGRKSVLKAKTKKS